MRDQQLDEPDCNCQSPLHLAASRGASICCVHLLKVISDIYHKLNRYLNKNKKNTGFINKKNMSFQICDRKTL
jgi:uncharacterized membrane protein YcgQ (UPF0703/DUF1980 family)